MITKKEKANFIEGSELKKLTFLLNISSGEWKDYSVETFIELQRIIISYIRCGFKGVDAVIPGKLVPLWNECKRRMDQYIKQIYQDEYNDIH